MTVKSQRGKRRYCAFTVDPSLTKDDLIRRLPKGRHFNVIQCADGMAAVRCAPDDIDECLATVREAIPSAEIVRVSGTLRTLRDRYSTLRKTASPRPPRKGTAPVALRETHIDARGTLVLSTKNKY